MFFQALTVGQQSGGTRPFETLTEARGSHLSLSETDGRRSAMGRASGRRARWSGSTAT